LGLTDYADALEVQRSYFDPLVAAKAGGAAGGSDTAPDESPEMCLLLCEHPHVYTLGRSGQEGNMLVSESYLTSIGATFYRTDRGGDVTYHGPGQIVAYPILDLERLGLGLKEYIHAVEQAVIRTLADYGIAAGRSEGATGVWLTGPGPGKVNISECPAAPARKICAIGVRSSRFVTMHGMALNVNTDLAWFGHINPCGFTDRGVTSLACELGARQDIQAVKRALVSHMEEIMNIKTYNYADRKKMGTQAPG
jgi:lipoyl(octanoyl) transferase